MDRFEIIRRVKEILKCAGFRVSEECNFKDVGFDLVASRDRVLLILKVLSNIDAFNERVANDLKTVSHLLKASLILIGERDGSAKLEDDVIYFRNGVPTITPNTFKNYLVENLPLSVYAAPGGFYVGIDGNKLKEKREEKNLSRGDLARLLHVSRRAVKMYEEGMDVRVEVAALIEELLDPSIIKSFDLFQPVKIKKLKYSIDDIGWLYNFQKEILSMVEDIGYEVIPTRRCIFDAVSKKKKDMLLTSVRKYNFSLKRRAKILNSIAKITGKHAVIFTDKEERRCIEGTPTICRKELLTIKDPEEMINIIIEREG